MREFYLATGRFVGGDVLVFDSPDFKTGRCYIHEDYRPGCLGEVWTREDAAKIFNAVRVEKWELPAAFVQRYPELLSV